jgi:hypothetical protein
MKTIKEDPPSVRDVLDFLIGPPVRGNEGPLLREAKRRIGQNVAPLGYEDPYKRVLNALVGKAETGSVARPYKEAGSPAFFGNYPGENVSSQVNEAVKERHILFNMLLGNETESLPKSSLREGSYTSPVTEKSIRGVLEAYPDLSRNTMVRRLTGANGPRAGYHGFSDLNTLGNFTVTEGRDEKGRYLEYEDTFDLNPVSDYRNKDSTVLPRSVIRAIEDRGQKLAGIKPPHILGRIYIDEQGNPL